MMEAEHRGIVVPAPASAESIVVRWPGAIIVLDGTQADVAWALRSLRPDGELEPASGLLIERLRMLRHADFAAGVSTPGGLRLFWGGGGFARVGAAEGEPSTEVSALETDGALLHDVDVALGPSPI